MVKQSSTFTGTMLKYLVEIEATGFDMNRDDFDIQLKKGPKSMLFHKSDLRTDSTSGTTKYYLCFDSEYFGPGNIQAIVTGYAPDTDFAGGTRRFVDKFDLVNVLAV